ncbi:MAG TPA: hypothetical protein DIU15_19965 [Deltaproteobacteria bacterium]|nr:hypothetical protein [Deltaproteobacteria bacterium]HCP48326.1 hypothetical protein [Deltaproteobacteria bacterium]
MISILKLPVKVALLPARLSFWVARGVARRILRRGQDGSATGVEPGAWASSSASAPEPPPPQALDVEIDPSEVLERMKDGQEVVFIDVRQVPELAASGMIEGAVHIPSQDLPHRLESLDPDCETVVYCAAGMRSLDAVMFLREKGFEHSWSLVGGLPHWQADGGNVVAV